MANKYEFFETHKDYDNQNTNCTRQRITTNLRNFYYNLWMNKFKYNGLDEECKEQQANYIMRKLWSDGTLACRKMKAIDMLVFCPYSEAKQNLYDFPEKVELINERDVSTRIIPNTIQTVNKDVCLIYAQPNHKPVRMYVDYVIDKIVDLEMILRTNTILQKMPFVLKVDDTNKSQLQDFMRRLLNDEVCITLNGKDLTDIDSLITNTPYIADKLKNLIETLHGEILTYLGIDNTGMITACNQTADEVNSNNAVINDSINSIEMTIKSGIERINKVFDRNITIECTSKPVDSFHDATYSRIEEGTIEEEDVENA